MAQLIVEIHIPLTATGLPARHHMAAELGDHPRRPRIPWIFEVEEYLTEREEQGRVEVYDDGEELGDTYLFFITGAGEQDLLAVAADVAALPGIPNDVFAIVTDADEIGVGRRVPLS